MERRDQCLKLGGGKEMNLVDEEDNATVLLLGGLAERDQEISEVVIEGAAIGKACRRLDVEAGREGFRRAMKSWKDLSTEAARAARSFHRSRGANCSSVSARKLAHPRPELGALGDLGLDRGPAAFARALLEAGQKHGLADAAKTRDQHRLLGMSAAESVEQDLKGLQLSVTTYKGRRPRPSVGRIRIVMRAHGGPYQVIQDLSKYDKTRKS